MLVHGFDVPLNKPHYFEALKNRPEPLARELNLKLRTIRTNIRELEIQDWEDSFMTQLSCCLHNYAHEFRYGLVGSSCDPGYAINFPWGSTPASDYLLSGIDFHVVHDGAAYSRTAKIAEISKHPTAVRAVKVCWQGEKSFQNCGRCETYYNM